MFALIALALGFASGPVTVRADRSPVVHCEVIKRGDGTSAVICQGRVTAFIGVDGTRHVNPYAVPAADDCAVY